MRRGFWREEIAAHQRIAPLGDGGTFLLRRAAVPMKPADPRVPSALRVARILALWASLRQT